MGEKRLRKDKKHILLRKERLNMGALLHLKEYKRCRDQINGIPCSFTEMILNPQKRQETYRYYDSRYEETEEEKEIFEEMSKRRRR